MKLVKQGVGYSLVGGAQFLLDWGVFVGLTALGMLPVPANVIGRLAGAVLGFAGNRKLTFPPGNDSKRRQFLRFVLLWIGMTVLSSVAIHYIAVAGALGTVWLLKPLVEAVLAIITFFACRHWVYR